MAGVVDHLQLGVRPCFGQFPLGLQRRAQVESAVDQYGRDSGQLLHHARGVRATAAIDLPVAVAA